MLILSFSSIFFFFNDTATTEIYTLSLHDALPILMNEDQVRKARQQLLRELPDPTEILRGSLLDRRIFHRQGCQKRSEEHTSELQSRLHLVCRLLLEKKKKKRK